MNRAIAWTPILLLMAGLSPVAAAPIEHACDPAAVPIELAPLPVDCAEAVDRDLPAADTPTCYRLDGMAAGAGTVCERTRIAVVLMNNMDADTTLDGDGDGVPDDGDGDGVHDLNASNVPADPSALPSDSVVMEQQLQDRLREWFGEVSYGRLVVDVDLFTQPSGDWYRFVSGQPGWANRGVFTEVCVDHQPDWAAYNVIATLRNGPAGNLGGACDRKNIDLPVAGSCGTTAPRYTNYLWVKNFKNLTDSKMGTLQHELGHALPAGTGGLNHAESISSWDGATVKYGDTSDTMGNSGDQGHFSIRSKVGLGWLPQGLISDVATTSVGGLFTVHALSRNTASDLKGLRVVAASGQELFVEYRGSQSSTWDASLDGILKRGALLKQANAGYTGFPSAKVVDATPETPTTKSVDSVLLPGRTYGDARLGIHISAVSRTSSSIVLDVRRQASWSISAAPTNVAPNCIATGPDQVSCAATSSDPDSPAAEHLYFWRLGTPSTYKPKHVADGANTSFTGISKRVWLAVSDRLGGETWVPAWPLDLSGQPVNAASTLQSVRAERLSPESCGGATPCRRFELTAATADADGDPVGLDWSLDGADLVYPEPLFVTDSSGEHAVVLEYGDGDANLVVGAASLTLETGRAWTERAGTGPAARRMHAMAFDSAGAETVMFGGRTPSGLLAAETWLWDGGAWTMDPTPAPMGPRTRHRMATDPTGGVLFFGGMAGWGQPFRADLWRWDGSTWDDLTPSPLPVDWPAARGNHRMLATHDAMYLFGGRDENQTFGDLWRFDPSSATWREILPGSGAWPSPRRNASLAWDADTDTFLLYGGIGGSTALDEDLLEDTWRFDVASETWTLLSGASAPGPLDRSGMVYDTVARTFVMFGGHDGDLPTFSDRVWEFDGVEWLDVTATDATRRFPARDVTAYAVHQGSSDDELVIFGGFGGAVEGETFVSSTRYYALD